MRKFLPFLPVFIVSYIVLLFNFEGLTAVGLAFTLFIFTYVFQSWSKSIFIKELFVLLAALQWIVGPAFAYIAGNTHFKYYMYVDQETYMGIVVPALILFFLGLNVISEKEEFNDSTINKVQQVMVTQTELVWVLFVVGILMPFLSGFIPSSLGFVAFLLGNLKFIAVIIAFINQQRLKWVMLVIALGLGFYSAVTSTVFHDFILWSAMIAMFLFFHQPLGMLRKGLIVIVGALSLFIIQSVKSDLRGGALANEENVFLGFGGLIAEELNSTDKTFEEKAADAINIRLNQGWIISKVFEHVPKHEPFAGGESIEEAFYNSLLPRFLNPSKKKAGGQENFARFTGFYLRTGTSMGVSVIGEAYANYGRNGTFMFMFVFGLLIAVLYRILTNLAIHQPTIWLWLPLIFLQAVKAETELYVVLNFMFKGSILVFVIFYFLPKITRYRL